MQISKQIKATFLASLAVSVPAHLFALTNVLHNYDNIDQTPTGVGAGASSGRWVLQLLIELHDRFGTNYNLPMLNGLTAILLLAAAACLAVKIFDIRSTVLCALWGGVFLCFPTVTSTMFFMYVVHYYALAAFLAVAAVWATQRYRFGFLAGAVFCAVSLGIYQSEFPMTATLFVLLLLKMLLNPGADFRKVFRRGLLYFATLVLGFAVYVLCLNLTLRGFGLALSNYQGVNQMGRINMAELPVILARTWKEIVKMPLQDYYGITSLPVLRLSVLILAVISGIVIFLLLGKRKRVDITLGCVFLCAVLPLAANGIVIMCPHSRIYTLMVYASVFLYLVPLMLADHMLTEEAETEGRDSGNRDRSGDEGKRPFFSAGKVIKNLVAAVLVVVIAHYIWLSNGNYMAQYYNTEQTKNYLNSLVTQVRMTEGFDTSLEWVFIGSFSDPSYHNPWKDVPHFKYGGNGMMGNLMMNYYSRNSWLRHYMGFDVPLADGETQEKLKKKKFVKKMPCYPNDGSIAVYKNYVIIKLS